MQARHRGETPVHLGYEPLQAGLVFLPFSGGIIITSGLASALLPRLGPKPANRYTHPLKKEASRIHRRILGARASTRALAA